MKLLFFVILFYIVSFTKSIPIDNGIAGDPDVQCGSEGITVLFNTKKKYEGNVYIKNHYKDDECKVKGDKKQKAQITLRFDNCGVKRRRSLEPRGMFVSNTIIFSFHPKFTTKVDLAMRIQCFYMEIQKDVSQGVESKAAAIKPDKTDFPKPVCNYEVLDGPKGKPIQLSLVGKEVYHKWTCDTDTKDTFCMVVYDCFVDDGKSDKIALLDQDGCSLDKTLLGELEYPTDLMAGRKTNVFKFADRGNLYFNCQIRISIKDPKVGCPRPSCSKRNRRKIETPTEAVIDVSPENGILVVDLGLTEDDLPSSLAHTQTKSQDMQIFSTSLSRSNYCMSQLAFKIFVAVLGSLFFMGLTIVVILCTRKTEKPVINYYS